MSDLGAIKFLLDGSYRGAESKFQKQIKLLKEQNETLKNSVNDLEAKLIEKGKEIAIRNEKLNELKNELHKRDESLQRKKQQVEDVHKAVHQAKKESAKKGRQVCRANNEVVQYRKQVLKLAELLKITEKALELACESLNKNISDKCEYCEYRGLNIGYGSCDCDEQFETDRTINYFKIKAKEMMKSE